jgi:phage terminase small subunit
MQGKRPVAPPYGHEVEPPVSWRKRKISGGGDDVEPEAVATTYPRPEPADDNDNIMVISKPEKPAARAKVAKLFPPCPSYLKGRAAELWPDIVAKLVREGDWDEHDSEAVTATYCCYLASLQAAIQNVSERGAVIAATITNVEMHNPYAKTLRDAAEAVVKYGDLLFLTPGVRWVRKQRVGRR